MNPQLQQLRDQLDDIDNRLMKLLAERFAATRKVGELKKATGMPAVDPAREEKQMKRIAELAEEYGVDPEYAQKFLRLTIDEVVKNHKRIMGAK